MILNDPIETALLSTNPTKNKNGDAVTRDAAFQKKANWVLRQAMTHPAPCSKARG
jgi:hypothetical protein